MPLHYYAYFFTTYTFIASVLIGTRLVPSLPFVALEILRGAVFIVAVSVFYIYLRFGLSAIQEFYIKLGLNPEWSLAFDTLVHFAPVIWVGGLPRSAIGFAGGYALFLVWYLTVRATVSLPKLYIPSIPPTAYDQWVAGYLPVVLVVSWAVTRNQKK